MFTLLHIHPLPISFISVRVVTYETWTPRNMRSDMIWNFPMPARYVRDFVLNYRTVSVDKPLGRERNRLVLPCRASTRCGRLSLRSVTVIVDMTFKRSAPFGGDPSVQIRTQTFHTWKDQLLGSPQTGIAGNCPISGQIRVIQPIYRVINLGRRARVSPRWSLSALTPMRILLMA